MFTTYIINSSKRQTFQWKLVWIPLKNSNHGLWNDLQNSILVVVNTTFKCQNWRMPLMQCNEDQYTEVAFTLVQFATQMKHGCTSTSFIILGVRSMCDLILYPKLEHGQYHKMLCLKGECNLAPIKVDLSL
jgi:hypothetical protein